MREDHTTGSKGVKIGRLDNAVLVGSQLEAGVISCRKQKSINEKKIFKTKKYCKG